LISPIPGSLQCHNVDLSDPLFHKETEVYNSKESPGANMIAMSVEVVDDDVGVDGGVDP